MDEFLSKCKCVFWKGYVVQHCLMAKWEKWNQSVGNNQVFRALLTDLSKASDFLPQKVLIAELNARGFRLKALKLLSSYLS